MLGGLLGIYKLFYFLSVNTWWDVMWNLLPLPVILFAKDYLFRVPGLNQTLIFIGKHATNIFLVHTFIRYYYCEAFTYGMRHFALIIAVLFLSSLILSMVIETTKKVVGYSKLIGRLPKIGGEAQKVK